jgi:hypothetical protein
MWYPVTSFVGQCCGYGERNRRRRHDRGVGVTGMPNVLEDLACTVPSRPAGDLEDQQMLAKARGSSRWDFTAVDIGRVTARMLRLSMSAVGLETMKWQPAQDLTMLITRVAGRDIRRRYTIAGRDHDTIYLDIYLHGHGIGSTWAQALRPGDAVSGIGPRGKFIIDDDADWIALIGDETSLPGIHAMLAAVIGRPRSLWRLRILCSGATLMPGHAPTPIGRGLRGTASLTHRRWFHF